MPLDHEAAAVFVAHWMSRGTVLQIANDLDMFCDDVIEVANHLRTLGLDLPARPRNNGELLGG